MLFGGGSKKNKPKILWENPAPNSNFGAQTIACDFSKVDFEKTEIILKFKRKTTDTKTIDIRLNEGLNEVCVGSSSYFFWRKYTLSKTGLVVDTGGYTSTYPEIKADNSCAIPVELKISGGGLNSLKSLLLRAFSHFLPALKPIRKEVPNMLFGGNKSGGKSSYPGYELKTGVLCSLPQVNQSNTARRSLAIPAGCIPICIKCSGTWNCYSGKGETSNLGISISDNNGKSFLNVNKNSGPQWMNISNGFYLYPLGAYDNDVEAAATINRIDVNTWGNGGMYDATTGKLEITAWLEKTGAGAGGVKPIVPKQYKRLYLYKDGDQCTDVTGGWAFTKPSGAAANYESSLNKDGCMYCSGQNSNTAVFKTLNAINMNEYDRLMVEFYFDGSYDNGNARLYGDINGTTLWDFNLSTSCKNKISFAGSGDLSGGIVSLKIGTSSYNSPRVYIKRVWLETVGE